MTINQVSDSNVQSIESGAPRFQGAESTVNKNEALGNVRPSKLATFGRVLLGICTLGISEGIRALVHKFSSRPAAEPRIDRPVASNPKLDLENNMGRVMNSTESETYKSCSKKVKANLLKLFNQIDDMTKPSFEGYRIDPKTVNMCKSIILSNPDYYAGNITRIQSAMIHMSHNPINTNALKQEIQKGNPMRIASEIENLAQKYAEVHGIDSSTPKTSPSYKDFTLLMLTQISKTGLAQSFRSLSEDQIADLRKQYTGYDEAKLITPTAYKLLLETLIQSRDLATNTVSA